MLTEKNIIGLQKLCGRWRTVPTPYKLKDIKKLEPFARYASQAAEIWQGVCSGEVVALKIFKVSSDDLDAKSVSTSYIYLQGICTEGRTEVLRRSSFDETDQT